MWNPFEENKNKIADMDKRLTHNSEIIEEDHGAIADLKRENIELRVCVDNLTSDMLLLNKQVQKLLQSQDKTRKALVSLSGDLVND